MKKIISLLVIVLAASLSQASEWDLQRNVTDHDVMNGSFCIASTSKATAVRGRQRQSLDGARIEVIARIDQHGNTQEPFVQVVFSEEAELPSETSSLTVKGSRETHTLDRIHFEGVPRLVFWGKLDERQSLIKDIQALSQLRVELKHQQKKLVDLRFGLRGSSRTIDRQFADCELNFDTPTPL